MGWALCTDQYTIALLGILGAFVAVRVGSFALAKAASLRAPQNTQEHPSFLWPLPW
jgi:hypothetical protein